MLPTMYSSAKSFAPTLIVPEPVSTAAVALARAAVAAAPVVAVAPRVAVPGAPEAAAAPLGADEGRVVAAAGATVAVAAPPQADSTGMNRPTMKIHESRRLPDIDSLQSRPTTTDSIRPRRSARRLYGTLQRAQSQFREQRQ